MRSHNLRCGGWKNFMFARYKFMLVTAKEWLKSVLNYRSYPKNKTEFPFFGLLCIYFFDCDKRMWARMTELLSRV